MQVVRERFRVYGEAIWREVHPPLHWPLHAQNTHDAMAFERHRHVPRRRAVIDEQLGVPRRIRERVRFRPGRLRVNVRVLGEPTAGGGGRFA